MKTEEENKSAILTAISHNNPNATNVNITDLTSSENLNDNNTAHNTIHSNLFIDLRQ